MARTMLDEYKTSDRFWAEAVNTACYAINRLYLHRILKKTSYELLTGEEQAPCIALRNMSIGDVCPKESEEPPHAQDQPSSSTQASPPTQNEDEAQVDEGQNQEDEPPQKDGNDPGEMQLIKKRRMRKNQGRHTQESTKQSNEITPSTPSSATYIRG